MDKEIVMVCAPLRWEGYRFADCLPPGRIAASENHWGLLRRWKSDLEFGQSDVEPAMVYFLVLSQSWGWNLSDFSSLIFSSRRIGATMWSHNDNYRTLSA